MTWPTGRVPTPMRGLLAHRRMRHAVGAYLDGELETAAGAEVAAHLSICWECSTVAETVRLLKSALRRRGALTPTALAARRLRRFSEELASGALPGEASPP